MPFEEQNTHIAGELNCKNCGAVLHFAPGTSSLKCEYCGAMNEIAPGAVPVSEDGRLRAYGYEEFIAGIADRSLQQEVLVVKCPGCGASTTLPANVTADACPFCATPLVVTDAISECLLQPHYVLPFVWDKKRALDAFKTWLKGRWFAPSDLVKRVQNESSQTLKGVYIPHWSWDADTETDYTGQRGEHYYTTETYTVNVNGRNETRTRQVQHTRWYPASGRVLRDFRDVLVSASQSLPQKTATILEPWDLDQLQLYDERYLSGFRAEDYQTDAPTALVTAKDRMAPVIRDTILADIGGDVQRIDRYDTRYHDVMLKYIQLPVWLSAYKYNGKLYQFVVNACTGEVTGERPYSAIKIVLAVLLGLALIAAIVWFSQQR